MMYNYFLKLYFFYQATLDEICIFLFFQKVFTFQQEGLYNLIVRYYRSNRILPFEK